LHAILQANEQRIYAHNTSEFVGGPIFERITTHEKREMLDWEGQAKVKSGRDRVAAR
jgi:hypothetical protein